MRLFGCLFLLAAAAPAGSVELGKKLALPSPTPVADVAANPERYAGKIVQIEGRITEVCQMMGCWVQLVNPTNSRQAIRVKVTDGEIVFPKDSPGKMAIAEGKLVKFELTREQAVARAKHEAEEQGRPFRPESVKTGVTIYQLQGSGAVILE
ncbi:MAG: DUF4920 domain-containing protein [Bryobacterales bacterium]|nr:DUF4920 domain-containing protein [Bryobacterales bacterium]